MQNKKWRLSLCLFGLLSLLLLMTGCQKEPEAQPPQLSYREVTDYNGKVFEVPETVESVISLSPVFTQVILDLNLGDLLIGVDTNSQKFYAETAALPAFDMMAPDGEQLLQLAPDLLLVSDMSSFGGADPFALVRGGESCVVDIATPATLEQIGQSVSFLAQLLQAEEAGAVLVQQYEDELEHYAALGAAVTEPKTVYVEIGAAPYIYSFGSGVFFNEMIELIGARNVFAEQEGWLSVTPEAAVAADADVIITTVDYLDDPVAEILSREGWETMQAIQNKQVYQIDTNASSQPNQHVTKALAQLYAAVYGEE